MVQGSGDPGLGIKGPRRAPLRVPLRAPEKGSFKTSPLKG